MDNLVATKQKIYQALQTLPPDALAQVERMVRGLQGETKPPLRLGGIWKDIPFDITNQDIRKLRRHLSRRILKRKV